MKTEQDKHKGVEQMSDYTKQKQTYRITNDPRQQQQTGTKKILYTCWRCNKIWDLLERPPQDTVRCPHCGMIHGQITNM
jgi:hypothetical protein